MRRTTLSLLAAATLLQVAAARAQTTTAPSTGASDASTASAVSGPSPAQVDNQPAIPQTPSPTPPPDPPPTSTDSKTCNVTVPILQAIPCGTYPSELQSFCTQYKPMQMDMAHCQLAEKYAQYAPPTGSRKDECARQTFGHGTSSWSFVLACSGTPTNQGSAGDSKSVQNKGNITNSGTTSSGAGMDPQCLSTLQGMGATFQNKGQVDHGAGPVNECIVTQEVYYTNRDVAYSGEMDCNLAVAMEAYGKKLKAIGVTRVHNLGLIGCRGMNNGRTASHSQSLHSYGLAADMDAWTINGQNINGAQYFTDPTARATIQTILNATCESFPGVLAYNFYKGNQGIHHIHAQVKQHTSVCDPPG